MKLVANVYPKKEREESIKAKPIKCYHIYVLMFHSTDLDIAGDKTDDRRQEEEK